jgi:hypothetical protein
MRRFMHPSSAKAFSPFRSREETLLVALTSIAVWSPRMKSTSNWEVFRQ